MKNLALAFCSLRPIQYPEEVSNQRENEYLLNLIFNLLYASTIALSDGVFAYFENIHECCLSSPIQLKLNPPTTLAFK